MLSKVLYAITFLAASVAAKESVHLVNCNDMTSRVYFYSNDGNNPPTDQTTVSQGGFIFWEGETVNARFSSGVTFSSKIDAGAQNRANFSPAGTGSNGFHNFNCFKDDKHTIAGTQCQSIYYCFDA